jgi:hypothetical protein
VEQAAGLRKRYRPPLLRKLTLEEANPLPRTHFRDFLDLIVPGARDRRELSDDGDLRCGGSTAKRPYTPTVARKRTTEQSRLRLAGCPSVGDQGTRDLMNLILPEPGSSIQNVAPDAVASHVPQGEDSTINAHPRFVLPSTFAGEVLPARPIERCQEPQ